MCDVWDDRWIGEGYSTATLVDVTSIYKERCRRIEMDMRKVSGSALDSISLHRELSMLENEIVRYEAIVSFRENLCM